MAAALILLGALSIVYLPMLSVAASWLGPEPGQARPVLFFSPDCPECRRSLPLIAPLVRRMGMADPLRIDSRLVRNELLLDRFDAAYRTPNELRGHVPALFYPGGFAVGEARLYALLSSRRPSFRPLSAPATGGFPWARWADSFLAGACLIVLGGLLGPRRRLASIAGPALLAIVLAISGAGKLVHPGAFASVVRRMPLIHGTAGWLAWPLGGAELLLCIALLTRRWRRTGLLAATGLLAVMTAFTALLMGTHYSGSCGCLPWQDGVGWWTLARDACLVGVGAFHPGLFTINANDRRQGRGGPASAQAASLASIVGTG